MVVEVLIDSLLGHLAFELCLGGGCRVEGDPPGVYVYDPPPIKIPNRTHPHTAVQGKDEELGKKAILKLMEAVDETIPTVRTAYVHP